MKKSTCFFIITIALLSVLGVNPVIAENVLDGVDPCVDAQNQFKAEESKVYSAYDDERNRIEQMAMPSDEYKKIWNQVAYLSAKKQIVERYSGITFTDEQLGQMSQKEVQNYINTVGENDVQNEMLTIFEEHKKQAIADLEKEKALTAIELDKQKKELNDACGTGEVERILRVIIAGIENRIKSMDSEATFDAKILKFSTGVSLADIYKFGLLGGPNSEARKVAKGIENIVAANIEAAKREKGDINKVIRATTGVSITDIKKHGILGGKNSEARKLAKALGF